MAAETVTTTPRMLVIDDDPDLGRVLASVARSCGYEAIHMSAPDDLKVQLQNWVPTHIVLDLRMPKLDGLGIMRLLAEQKCTAAIVVMSGADKSEIAEAQRQGRALGLSVLGAVGKPIALGPITKLFKALLSH